jgi:hypothetical protein
MNKNTIIPTDMKTFYNRNAQALRFELNTNQVHIFTTDFSTDLKPILVQKDQK